MIMLSRSLADLDVNLLVLYYKFKTLLENDGINHLVTCTYRDNKTQNDLYAMGRTQPGKIITNAKGGQSKHNVTKDGKPASRAFDIVIMDRSKCVWNASDERWSRAGKHGESIGLVWLGNSIRFREFPHFQLPD